MLSLKISVKMPQLGKKIPFNDGAKLAAMGRKAFDLLEKRVHGRGIDHKGIPFPPYSADWPKYGIMVHRDGDERFGKPKVGPRGVWHGDVAFWESYRDFRLDQGLPVDRKRFDGPRGSSQKMRGAREVYIKGSPSHKWGLQIVFRYKGSSGRSRIKRDYGRQVGSLAAKKRAQQAERRKKRQVKSGDYARSGGRVWSPRAPRKDRAQARRRDVSKAHTSSVMADYNRKRAKSRSRKPTKFVRLKAMNAAQKADSQWHGRKLIRFLVLSEKELRLLKQTYLAGFANRYKRMVLRSGSTVVSF